MLSGYPRAVADEEAGVAGELILCLGDDLDDEFFAGDVGSGQFDAVDGVGFVQFEDDAVGVGELAAFNASKEGPRDSATSGSTSS